MTSLAWRAGLGLGLAWLSAPAQWPWLQELTTDGFLALANGLGIAARRTGPFFFVVGGESFEMTLGCTQLVYFAGVMPCLIDLRRSPLRNVGRLAAMFAGLFLVNQVRLALLFQFWNWGASWQVSHDLLSGLIQFVIIAAGITAAARAIEPEVAAVET